MPLLEYSYLIILPFIILFSLPLAISATLTSVLAFTVLFIRVLVIYAELAIAVVPYYLLGLGSSKKTAQTSSTSNIATTLGLSSSNSHISPPLASPTLRRRKRRTSASSAGSLTPVPSSIALELIPSIGPSRDFEGVGGWRLDAPSEDESLWTNINSRLELPADHIRRHKRSLTSGSMPGESVLERRAGGGRSHSPETAVSVGDGVSQSPNTGRVRTPPSTAGGEGYFPPLGSAKVKKSSSTSSGSSKGSGGLRMKNRP